VGAAAAPNTTAVTGREGTTVVGRNGIVALTLGVVALVQPAGALASSAGPLSAVHDRAAQRVGVSLLILDEAGRPRSPTEAVAALPGLVAATWGGEAVQASAEDADQPVGVIGAAGGLGFDATGDRVEDVAGYAIDVSTDSLSLFTWNGVGGEDVWVTPASVDGLSFTAFTTPDLTGDDITDLVELTLGDHRNDSVCEDRADGFTCVYDETFTWHVDVVSGASGQRVLRRSQDGYFRGTEEQTADRYEAELQSRNIDPVPVPTADHDGDGANDVVVHDTDVEYRRIVDGSSDVESLRSDAVGRLLGAGFSELASFAVTDVPGIPRLVPAGDLTGDGVSDLVWTTDVLDGTRTSRSCLVDDPVGLADLLGLCTEHSVPTYATLLQVVDGADLHVEDPVVVRDSDRTFSYSSLVADDDPTGDGVADLRLLTIDLSEGGLTEVHVVDGRTRQTVWQYATTDVVGSGYLTDATADGRPEVVLSGTFTYSEGDSVPGEGSTTVTYTHVVLDGATGQIITDDQVTATRDYGATAFALFAGTPQVVDLTEDGVPDPLVQSVFGTHDEVSDTPAYESVLRVMDGADLSRTVLVDDGPTAQVYSHVADIDGDGDFDIIRSDYGPQLGFDITATAIDPRTGAIEWTLPDISVLDVIAGADGSDDVLRSTVTHNGPHFISEVSRLDGVTLAEQWHRQLR
jgi:hypothetical protein